VATYKLEPSVWQPYFDKVSKHLAASRAEIRVSGLDLGSQIAAADLPLEGMSYDPYEHELLITSEDLEQHIAAREIFVDEELGNLRGVEVVDSDGHRRVITLSPVLELLAEQ
jgi:hypothetical protein